MSVVRVYSSLYTKVFIYSELHTHKGSEYAAITPTLSMSTDTIESFLQFLAKHCTRLPDDGSSVIRNMLEHFEIFYNFNCIYILHIVHALVSKVFNYQWCTVQTWRSRKTSSADMKTLINKNKILTLDHLSLFLHVFYWFITKSINFIMLYVMLKVKAFF